MNSTGWFVRRLLLDALPAGVTQTILPTIPALEDNVTAQAGGESRIHGAYDFSSSVCALSTRGFFTHEVLSDTQGVMEVASCVRPPVHESPEDMCQSPQTYTYP
jgi:hypothetical protein